ncbi:MAG: peptidoglycan bridge formation glycyltransferase FemA/FemB family protein [Nocardioidaceae bacterium]|nr:peptidoglycan bridge formation glycyltransferase FemA/FemB family protein [Nocardioidaceae bacterium]
MAVRPITPVEHLDFLRTQRSASFLQTPAWGAVKSEWRRESLGWFDQDRLVGVGLVLYRQLPKVRRYLAYLPEGPVIDWSSDHLADWLTPMKRHLRAAGAFGVRMGPPVITRRWSAEAVKGGVADESIMRLGDVPPTERSRDGARVVSQLQELGWRPQSVEGGFAAGQPQLNFQIPLRHREAEPDAPDAPDGQAGQAGLQPGEQRSEDEVLAGMNQQWRRNIKKAAKEGVEVGRGDEQDLKAFHDLYVHTAGRDHFTPRPLAYFQAMFGALSAEEPDRITLFLARHDGDLVAATILIRVGGHTWYSYGASSTEKRDVRGSNAVQWAMITDALASGADVYDLRGITDTLDPEDPHVGLIQFKVGTGGEAVEYAGEWDLPLSPLIYKAFALYMARRSAA